MAHYDKKGKFIDLKINGRMFPSWISANFKKYKLEQVLRKSDEDPCNVKSDSGQIQNELRQYQSFVSQFLDYRSTYRDILIYHGLGSGKTLSAINVYNALYNYTPGWNVFILIKASLKGSWLAELKEWLKKDEYEHRFQNIIFIHYDSPFADRNFLDALKNVDNAKKSLYIIDEVHNFIRNVYSNISSGVGKRAQVIYDYIIQDKKENPDTRVVLLSGTPAINKPFELALLFNLLRPGIFPKSENEFNNLFVTSTNYQTLNKTTKNMFQRRILGLVTYYIGATYDLYATQKIHYVDVPMSTYQDEIYAFFEDIETKMALNTKIKGSGNTVYKVYTRQACNFVFPALNQTVNGEGRPRPGKFRISERESIRLSETGEIKDADKNKLINLNKYLEAVSVFINTFKNYLDKQNASDKENGHTIFDDIQNFISKHDGDFAKFNKEETNKSKLFAAMYVSSPKMTNILFNIMKSPGPVTVYSNYVLMEGLEMFKVYLDILGFYNWMTKKQLQTDKIGYVEFHGGIKDLEDRYAGMRAYNNVENKNGGQIKVILISPAGAEGLSLKNVRQIHIMEPYWNEVRIVQMIGRGIRQCSHKDLPMDQRHVDIYRYRSIRSRVNKQSTDEYIEDVARSKDNLIQSFLDAVKEAAVDCNLFKAHNMISQEYKCFQFNEPSLFESYIGPAYKDDINDDIKIDNGLNSLKSNVLKIKVMKIKAVKLLSKPDDEEQKYSPPENYWLYEKTGVVYDFELHYPIGSVSIDEGGLFNKLDKDTYIIDHVLSIPIIDE